MPDDEEWMGTSQESNPSGHIAEKGDKTEISPQPTVNETSIPSGDVPGKNEREVMVADDDSSHVMGLDFLMQLPYSYTKYKRCSSSALRSQRYMLVALLLFVAMLLLAIVIAVPVVTKSVIHSANSVETSSRPSPIDADWDESAADNEGANMSTASTRANEYTSTIESDFHNTSKEENEANVGEFDLQASISEMVSTETFASTSSSLIDMNNGINQDTGEEFTDLPIVSTIATSPFTTYMETLGESISAPIAHNDVDQNTGEQLYKEPISIILTSTNIPSHTNFAEQDASNDVSLSIVSTVEASSEINVGDNASPVKDQGSNNEAEPANNSIDGIISTYMSPSEQTDRESQWLKAHNTRRKQWHKENNVSFIPLKWSTGLASNALVWANVLIDQEYESFDLYHDDDTDEGENLAMNRGSGSWNRLYHPDEILQRWVEEEVGLSPPDNLHLTQVLWRPTKYVGCAEAVREYDNGKTCHVQVCRYTKMGNCNLGKYSDWMVPMLLDDSQCGLECPPEGCI